MRRLSSKRSGEILRDRTSRAKVRPNRDTSNGRRSEHNTQSGRMRWERVRWRCDCRIRVRRVEAVGAALYVQCGDGHSDRRTLGSLSPPMWDMLVNQGPIARTRTPVRRVLFRDHLGAFMFIKSARFSELRLPTSLSPVFPTLPSFRSRFSSDLIILPPLWCSLLRQTSPLRLPSRISSSLRFLQPCPQTLH